MDKQEVGTEHPELTSSIFVQGVRNEGLEQVAKTQLGVILPAVQSLGSVFFASPAESCSGNVCSKSHCCVPTLSQLVYKLVSL